MSEPLPPEEHEKPLQDDADENALERGDYVDDPEGQDAIWEESDDTDDAAG